LHVSTRKAVTDDIISSSAQVRHVAGLEAWRILDKVATQWYFAIETPLFRM
jgi:hypothetical protein